MLRFLPSFKAVMYMKMLNLSPKKRITVEEALAHPYLEELHDEEDEPNCEFKFDFSFEKNVRDLESVKSKIF